MILFVLIPIILTLVVEFIVYFIAMRKNYGYLILYAILINTFTNPLASLFFGWGFNFWGIEFVVFIAEIFLIKYLLEVSYKKAIIISLIANVITAFLSLFFL